MSRKIKIIIIISIVIFVVAAGYFYYDYHNQKVEVIFFDVGQGDAALINLPGNNEILIDGGPDMTVLYKLGKYLPIYDRSIELMILTHPHVDHVTGLVEVLKRYEVKKVMLTYVKYESGIYEEFLKTIGNKSSKIDYVHSYRSSKMYIEGIESIKPGDFDKIEFGSYILEILYPWQDLENVEVKDVNDSSIVVRLITSLGNKFLFTGDISIDIEKEISEKVGQENLEAKVLKVAHQGSDTSSSIDFVQAVSPDYAIISVGENEFGHPSLRVIRCLERIGAQVLRTDKLGDIKFGINKAGQLELK